MFIIGKAKKLFQDIVILFVLLRILFFYDLFCICFVIFTAISKLQVTISASKLPVLDCYQQQSIHQCNKYKSTVNPVKHTVNPLFKDIPYFYKIPLRGQVNYM